MKKRSQALFLFLSLFFLNFIQKSISSAPGREKEIIDLILDGSKYDPRIRATPTGDETAPTKVTTNFYLRSIESIDDIKMTYKVQITFRMEWEDSRLAYSDNAGDLITYVTLLPETIQSKLWTPDLFFANELEAHSHGILRPNTYARVFPDGKVLYSTRLSLTLSCPMDLRLFPSDTQKCNIRMASYGYNASDIVFAWKETDPVQMAHNLYLPKFTLQRFSTDTCDSRTNTGVYSCLFATFEFSRDISSYICYIYVPSTMLLVISYLSLWINQKESTSRILLSLFSILIMAVRTDYLNSMNPPTSYTKRIDIWNGILITLAFIILVLNVLGNYFMHGKDTEGEGCTGINDEEMKETSQKKGVRELNHFLGLRVSEKLQLIGRVGLPIIFGFFVLIHALA